MKKTVIFLLVFVGAAGAQAQSTCQTRVDAHQNATTNQRVNYCLRPGYGEDDQQGPHLIFSTTNSYTVPQPVPARAVKPTASKGSFDDADIEVTHSFVQTRQFPKFTDGRVSEQYKIEYQDALLSGPQAAEEVIAHVECEPQEDISDLPTDGEKETEAGVNVRQKKPGRRWVPSAKAVKQVEPTTEQTASAEPENVEEVSSMADQYTYENSSYAPSAPSGYVPAGDTSKTNTEGLLTNEYSYAPASYGDDSEAKQPESATSAAAESVSTSQSESTNIAVGEYAYAPASYGDEPEAKQPESAASAAAESVGASQSESADIAVGEYSYAPAQ